MPDRQLQPGGAAHAVADDVGLRDAEVVHQRRDIIGHLLVAKGAVDDVGGVPMALQLDGDDLVVLGQGGEDRSPQVDRPKGAMEQHQRLPGAVDLVVHLQPVDRGVAALRARLRHGRRGVGFRLGEAPRRSDQGGPGSRGHGDKCPSLHHHGLSSRTCTCKGKVLRATHRAVTRPRAVSPLLPWRVSAVYTGSEEIVGRRNVNEGLSRLSIACDSGSDTQFSEPAGP